MATLFGELVSPITEFLKCLALWFLGACQWLILGLVNLLVAVLMAIIQPVLELLPQVNLEHISLPPWLATIAYILPLQYMLSLALLALAFELVWWTVQIALRWARAIS